jgi:hypothetical protein
MREALSATSINSHVRLLLAATIAFPAFILALAGCGGHSSNAFPASTTLYVNPSTITVAAGSIIRFTAVYGPAPPAGGSLSWSVAPISAGTITEAGIYTASATAGQYLIIGTWTPTHPYIVSILRGSAKVDVLAVPQFDSVISPGLVQASGANQVSGAIQNAAVTGQGISSVFSEDPGGNIRVRSGFTPPMICPPSNPDCQ